LNEPDINECLLQLRAGRLEMTYVRYDERADRFYCTLKPHRPLIEGLPVILNATASAFVSNGELK
jgi:hypothetical protein